MFGRDTASASAAPARKFASITSAATPRARASEPGALRLRILSRVSENLSHDARLLAVGFIGTSPMSSARAVQDRSPGLPFHHGHPYSRLHHVLDSLEIRDFH